MQSMEIYEIICGALILLFSVLVVILCLMQDTKTQQNMTSALGGGSNDSFYGKNEGRTREAMLAKLTKYLSILIFVLIFVVSIAVPCVSALMKSDDSTTTTPTSSVADTTAAATEAATDAATDAETSAE